MKQSTDTIFMVRPSSFGYNGQTSETNRFQGVLPDDHQKISRQALEEFDNLTTLLKSNQIRVIVADDQDADTPDSIFPNNWFSSHPDGRMVLYPMLAPNRRMERKPEIISMLKSRFRITDSCDLSSWEGQGQFLEGTGSLVLDHLHRKAYACLSARTSESVLRSFEDSMKYPVVRFRASHETKSGKFPVYHTNVLLSIGTKWCVICSECFDDNEERTAVIQSLLETGREIISISMDQMMRFAGNMLELRTRSGDHVIVMSSAAHGALLEGQLNQLSSYGKIIHTPLPTIEEYGGGSARCMLAELFFEQIRHGPASYYR